MQNASSGSLGRIQFGPITVVTLCCTSHCDDVASHEAKRHNANTLLTRLWLFQCEPIGADLIGAQLNPAAPGVD